MEPPKTKAKWLERLRNKLPKFRLRQSPAKWFVPDDWQDQLTDRTPLTWRYDPGRASSSGFENLPNGKRTVSSSMTSYEDWRLLNNLSLLN